MQFSRIKMLAAACAVVLASSVSAGAATLDFSGVQGFNGNPLVLSNATITNQSFGTVLVGAGAAGEVDGFCFLLGGTCESDGEIVFSSAVTNLSFDSDLFDDGDSVTISAYNGVTLLGSIVVTSATNLDFSGFGAITSLFFDDNSSGAGFGWSTFVFDEGTSSTPVPAALPLFATGLAALGLIGRRKRRVTAAA